MGQPLFNGDVMLNPWIILGVALAVALTIAYFLGFIRLISRLDTSDTSETQ